MSCFLLKPHLMLGFLDTLLKLSVMNHLQSFLVVLKKRRLERIRSRNDYKSTEGLCFLFNPITSKLLKQNLWHEWIDQKRISIP